ncbi:MAG: SEC-C metal-binding domain-containing protein [Planctomycetia bacterium]|nr:SEC-C metal-binding domain-containing protein [Planctomycetia bacterium]
MLQVEPAKLRDKDRDTLEDNLKEWAKQTAHDVIDQTMGEFIPEDLPADEDEVGAVQGEADYRGLAQWASTQFGIKVRERDISKLTEDELRDRLFRPADEEIDKTDFSPIDAFLDADFGRRTLVEWCHSKFDMRLGVQELGGTAPQQIVEKLVERLDGLYAQKERLYPIDYAIEDCISPHAGARSFDFEALAAWASRQYLTPVAAADLRSHDLDAVRNKLLAISDTFEQSGRLDELVSEATGRLAGGADPAQGRQRVAQWAAQQLGLEITTEELEKIEPEEFGEFLKFRFATACRSRMNELERFLLLQVHDIAWKDHLRHMDDLKEGIGLRSYAQKEPLIEYKREGLELFEHMLDRIRDSFTDLFFKARFVQREALSRIWAGQAAEHQEAEGAFELQRRAALEASQTSEQEGPRKPIVRAQPRVGRNQPCPCGSGKKFKHCCGRRA